MKNSWWCGNADNLPEMTDRNGIHGLFSGILSLQ
jgi:hypothetical protein